MKNVFFLLFSMLCFCSVYSQDITVFSPDEHLSLTVFLEDGKPMYSVKYKGKVILKNSPLGLITNEDDFSINMEFVRKLEKKIDKRYTQDRIKKTQVHYKANTLLCTFLNNKKKEISILFQVSNNDVAFRYELPTWGDQKACVVKKEITGFRFPSNTTAFVSYMMEPMGAFARTSPSYESGYQIDVPIEETTSHTGYVFPGLFRIGNDGWALLSETGVRSLYCASHLSRFQDGIYTVEYPNVRENNGFGSTGAQIGLPGVTPWRTITIGDDLKPIVETTIPFDVVEPLYQPSQEYKYGRSTWSWIVWQDNSMNWEDQIRYIDLASEMGYEYILIDALWDTKIGYDKMEKLIQYANLKNVDVFLWYNSNGSFNDAPQSPKNCMNTSIARKKEMKWLNSVGVKGLKVDFFGGDKQETMQLYEDILSDANDYGLMIIFHGCTLPRGWERMYPNYVGSEAVLASEMLIFSEDVRKNEALYASLHPFIRNTVGSMEFGGVFFNKFLNKENKKGQERLTTDAFQLATGILFQNPVQMFAITPNNLIDAPASAINFMKNIPTTWDETVYIDGYPGKHVVLARRSGDNWYIAGINAGENPVDLNLNLPMLIGQDVSVYNDKEDKKLMLSVDKIDNKGEISISIQPNSGFVLIK